MKSYDIVDDYQGLGQGTLFCGDSGYIDDNEDLIERLKEDLESHFSFCEDEEDEVIDVDVEKIEFIETGEYLEVFIKGFNVMFS